MRKYFIAGDKLLGFNAKCCTTALCREIIRTYYPDLEEFIQAASYPEGVTVDTARHHRWVPQRINPDRPVVVLLRDPAERFRSAMAEVGLDDVDAVLAELAAESGDYGRGPAGRLLAANVHFLPQTRFEGDITYYTEPDEAAAALGVQVPLPTANESSQKPTLTPSQEHAVREWYANDQTLWDSLTSA